MASDGDPGQNDHMVTEPAAIADEDRGLGLPLARDGLGDILLAVVHVGNAHVVAGPHVVADLDELVADHT